MVILDRIENDIAVLETDNGMQEVARQFLPKNAREGDVLVQGTTGYEVDTVATATRRSTLAERTKRLRKKF